MLDQTISDEARRQAYLRVLIQPVYFSAFVLACNKGDTKARADFRLLFNRSAPFRLTKADLAKLISEHVYIPEPKTE